jgi:phosphatidate cytidylyltransferase
MAASGSPERPTSAVDPARRLGTPRAGRNLWAAIAVGLLLSSGVLVALFTVRHVFIGIVAAAVAISSWELAGAMRRGGIAVSLPPVVLGGQAMVWLAWPFGRDGILLAFPVARRGISGTSAPRCSARLTWQASPHSQRCW